MMTNVLIVIPARGGSKGIPRKNVRALCGKPLISYSISIAQKSRFNPDVFVSSDDDEILSIAEKMGAQVHRRDPNLSADGTTLDPVIYDAFKAATNQTKKKYDVVVTLQPTSPLLRTSTLDKALSGLVNDPSIDTIISAIGDTHLTWRKEDNGFVPNYEKRVNRQYLPQVFKETGGFLITREKHITPNSRIGPCVQLKTLSKSEGIDIDDYDDWALCDYFLKRKKVLFVTAGNAVIGLGHVYNTLIMAGDIMNNDVQFLVDRESQMAFEKIASMNYPVLFQEEGENLLDLIENLAPDLVINDTLDTSREYIRALRSLGAKVVTIEDLGQGAREADLVINSIYPEDRILPNHYCGQNYFLLRDEFLFGNKPNIRQDVKNVLITFGGVDPNNYTLIVLSLIYPYCCKNDIEINIVTGLGYNKYETISGFDKANVYKDVKNISEYMSRADVIFTSAGRTIYEVAALGVPAIVMAQNERELLHFFASEENGFVNLGLGTKLSDDNVVDSFVDLVTHAEKRLAMSNKMKMTDFKANRKRVNDLVNRLLED